MSGAPSIANIPPAPPQHQGHSPPGIQRLRRLLDELEDSWFYEGKTIGENWAAETAIPTELFKLECWLEEFQVHETTEYQGRVERKVIVCEYQAWELTSKDILDAIYRNYLYSQSEYPSRVPEPEFWPGILPVGYPDRNAKLKDDGFIRGFIEGALRVLKQV